MNELHIKYHSSTLFLQLSKLYYELTKKDSCFKRNKIPLKLNKYASNFKINKMAKSLNILLIEDDAIEVMKFNRVLKSLELNHRIIEANNGEEAVDLLKRKEIIPDVIILDLNMPKLNGIEFLSILKADDVLKYIPAIILTTSNNHRDVMECYKIGIAGYILKPLKYEDYVDRIKKILDYWSTNELISQ